MKYKVTTRGWIVFSIIGILFVLSLSSLIGSLTKETDSTNDPVSSTEENSLIESEENSSEMNNDDNTDENNSSNTDESVTSSEDDSSNDSSTPSEDVTIEDNEEAEDATEETTTSDTTTETEISVEIDLDMRTEILFDKNIFELNSSYLTTLEEWLDIMENDETLEITVEGHINGYPYYDDGDFGLALALSRATIISDYFIAHGISYERINIINMGSTDQIDKSESEENHYLNRRAVIYFTKKP